MSLSNKSLIAVIWSGADVFMRQGLQFFVSILLARLLLPEDFGVIAMLYVFIGLANVFVDSGFSSALIQRQDTTVTDESTVFFFNLGMAALAAMVLCVAAPWIAKFFELPILQSLTYVMSLNLFVSAFGSIHTTLLAKELNFKTIMSVGGVATFFSGLLAGGLAWQGFGIWSLAWQTLSSSLISVALLWRWHSWRPRWEFDLHCLRRLFRFGGFLMISSLVDTLYERMYIILIGKLFSARDLGFYTRAVSTQQLPVNLLTSMLSRVAFPAFSSVAKEPERLARGVRRVLMIFMLLNIPTMLGMAVLAEPLVVTLFGIKWLPSVPFLQVLCLASVFWPHNIINLSALQAQGRSDLFFRLEIIKKCIGLPLMILASLHSVMAFAWVRVFMSVSAFFINAHYSGVLLGYGPRRQLRDIMPFGLVAMAMSGTVWLLGQWLHWIPSAGWIENLLHWPATEWADQLQHWPPVAALVALSVLGTTLYIVACHLLRLSAFDELITMIRLRKDLRPAPKKT